MRKVDAIALVLAIIGALNWGLVAIAEFDLVAEIAGLEFGQTNALTRIIYGLVGLSGLWLAIRAAELLRDRHEDRTADRGYSRMAA